MIPTQRKALPCLIDLQLEPPPPKVLPKRDGERDVTLPRSIDVAVDAGVPLLPGLALGVDGGQGQAGKGREQQDE